MPGNQNISFFQGELHGLKYQMLSGDLLISYRYASVYPYQLQQSLGWISISIFSCYMKTKRKDRQSKKEQEVGDNLSVCVLNLEFVEL